MTNDFICESRGVIVTEYCKQLSTWETYRDKVKYMPSREFLNELMSEELVREQESSAITAEKEISDLQVIMDMISKGAFYWNKLMEEGMKKSLISYQEQTAIKQVVNMALTGNIPASNSGKVPYKTMSTIKMVLAVKDKLEAEGIVIDEKQV